MKFGFTGGMTMDGHPVVVGPFNSREAATAASDGRLVVEWQEAPGPGNPCPDCGATYERPEMPPHVARVYDALFPAVLDWREDDDCGMAGLMLQVATVAAQAALEGRADS